MDMKKLLFGTLAGGLAFFVVGSLFYGILLAGFYESNLGSAIGVVREVPIWWALVISQFGFGAMLTYVFIHADVTTAAGGLKIGATFGLLFGVAIAFDLFGVTNWSNVTVAFVEPVVTAARMAIAGSVVGWTLGKMTG